MVLRTNSSLARRFARSMRALILISVMLAMHCAGIALAQDNPNTDPLLQSAASGNVSATSRTYLKEHGGKWFRVTRGFGARQDVVEPASQPVSLTKASASSGLFKPFVTFPVGSWPDAVAIGDVNGDGRNDVVLTTSFYFDDSNDYKLFVFLQNSSGTLEPPIKYSTHGTYSHETVAVGDVNHDGRNDVVVGNSDAGFDVFLQNLTGGLDSAITYTGINSSKIKIADLNHDGLLDVVGVGWGTDTASVWLQNAAGTLNAPLTYGVTHDGYDDLEVGDVNNDGLQDVIVMSGQGLVNNLGILLQRSDGTFGLPVYYDIGGNILTHGVAVGDINGDNRNDVVVSYGGNKPDSNIGAFLQNASAALDPAKSYSSYDCPEPIEIADVNNDGRNDVIVAHGGWDALGVYLQGADGTLMAESLDQLPYATHYNPHGLAVGDINGDGFNDVVIADYNHGLVVLYNNSAPALAVTTSPVTGITTTTATGGGNVTSDGGVAVTRRGVCWNTAGNPTTGDSCTTDGSGTGTFTSSITGLTPGTPYHVRAYATNASGTAYGDDVTFTTAAIPPMVVTTSAVTGITSTSATCGGNVTYDGGLAVTRRGVCWNTAGNPTTGDSCTTDGSGTGTFTSSITGLTPGTPYHVRAYATNASGTAYGGDVTFTTSAAIPTISVTSPNGNEVWIMGDSHLITWSHTGDPGDKVKIQLYQGTSLKKTITAGASMNSGSFIWSIPSTLKAGSDYKINIISKTNGKISDASDSPFTINAPTIAVTSPNGGESLSTGNTIPITWNHTGYAGNPGAKAKIQLYRGNSPNRTITTGALLSAGAFNWTIPISQKGGTNYRIRITSKTDSKISDMSDNFFSIGK